MLFFRVYTFPSIGKLVHFFSKSSITLLEIWWNVGKINGIVPSILSTCYKKKFVKKYCVGKICENSIIFS